MRVLLMTYLGVFGFAAQATAAGIPDMRPAASCAPCLEINTLLDKHGSTTDPTVQIEVADKIAVVIGAMKIQRLELGEAYRQIYFAIKGTIEVLDDDVQSETVAKLILLRYQNPTRFDYVFWRFPVQRQKELIQYMRTFKDNPILKKQFNVPTAKAIES